MINLLSKAREAFKVNELEDCGEFDFEVLQSDDTSLDFLELVKW